MATFLVGHGTVIDGEQVKVPDGGTISFLTEPNRTLPYSSGIGTVLDAEWVATGEWLEFASRHAGGEVISNHRLNALTNEQRMAYSTVDPENGTCFFSGDQLADGLRLCETPGPEGKCWDNPGGEHDCGGLLSLPLNDMDWYWVACRANSNPMINSGKQYNFGEYAAPRTRGSDDADPEVQWSEYNDFLAGAIMRLTADRTAFGDYFDSLDQQQIAILMGENSIRDWSYGREARRWMDEGVSAEDFYAFMNGQDEVSQNAYLSAPGARDWFRRGELIRGARDYLHARGADNFRLYANDRPAEDREVLASDPELAEAMALPAVDPTSAAAQQLKFGLSYDEIEWAVVQEVSQQELAGADDNPVPFWQGPQGHVAIGRAQPVAYRKLIEMVRDGNPDPTGDDYNGRISVVHRTVGRWYYQVTGAQNQEVMRDWMAAITDREVRFA